MSMNNLKQINKSEVEYKVRIIYKSVSAKSIILFSCGRAMHLNILITKLASIIVKYSFITCTNAVVY